MDILNLPFTTLEGKDAFETALEFTHVIDVEHQTELLASYFPKTLPIAALSTSQLLLNDEEPSDWATFVRANADVLKDAGVVFSEQSDDISIVLAIYWQPDA